jgi:SET domain-containing protein
MITRKENVLEILKKTYCRLKPSMIRGVGVFAIKNIPKNIDPFFGVKPQRWYTLNTSDLKGFDKSTLEMIDDFYVIEKNGDILVPAYGLNGMDISFFLNHSEKPNVERMDDGSFRTIREIKKDEELVVSYGTYDYKWKK